MTQADEYERYMLELINAERAKVGAAPLRLELNLNQAAEDHSEWMLATDIFSHTGVGGSSPTERMRAADFDLSGSWRTAENIAVQSERGSSGIMDDVADLHRSLMNSPGHRANILNPDLDYIGIGIELGNFDYGSGEWRSVIVTQKFGSTSGSVDLDHGAIQPSPADDVMLGTSGADQLQGGRGDDEIRGRGGRDLLEGGGGHDHVHGGWGADRLFGNAGDDVLIGARGADVLIGGAGRDVLHGQRGADRFVFRKGCDVEIIADFQNNRDTIDLRSMGFDTVRQALREADRTGDNVVFDFGDGDRLVIRDVTLAQLENDLLV